MVCFVWPASREHCVAAGCGRAGCEVGKAEQCVVAAKQQRRLRNRRVVLVSRARPVPGITLRRSRIQALPERRASGRFATGGVGKKPFPTLPRSYSLILGRLEIPPGFAVVDST